MDNLRYVHFHHFTDESVINTLVHTCYSTCDLSDSNGNVEDMTDTSLNDFNSCCNSVSTTSGYGILLRGGTTCTALCKFCCNYIPLQILILI